MRYYIENFLADFEYDKEETKCLLSAYESVTADEEANKLWNEAVGLYGADYRCDFGDVIRKVDKAAELTGINEYTAELLIFICLSKRLKELYIERGISLEIYGKSMLDLKYKTRECRLVYGIVGSFVADWFCGFFELNRFGMGRLQFEIISFGENYEKNGMKLSPDTKVINVHIPRSLEPLTEESCKQAYLLAKEFFKDEIKSEICPFVCDSWLLYPENEKILSPNSNTFKFLKSFDVFKWCVNKNRGNLWRLFDTMEQDVDKLPSDTTMRRAYIAHLKNGGKVGSGRGVLFL